MRVPWPVVVTGGWNADPASATVDALRAGGHLPFHGIFSRGMLDRWIEMKWATARGELGPRAAWWPECAPLLEHCWNAHRCALTAQEIASNLIDTARALDGLLCTRGVPMLRAHSEIPEDVAQGMVDAALTAGVVSHHQGVAAAIDHLTREGGAGLVRLCEDCDDTLSLGDIASVALNPIREGHVSSVFRVTVELRGGDRRPRLLGLNVARDLTSAATELEAMRVHLQNAAALDPHGVVASTSIATGNCERFGTKTRVPVLGVAWLDGVREIHVVRDAAEPRRGRILLVDEFRPDAVRRGAVRGEKLTVESSDAIWAAISVARTRQARIDPNRGLLETANVELNHGDFVLRGSVAQPEVTLVATSQETILVPLGAWPYELALASARDEANPGFGQLRWGHPPRALTALRDALARRTDGQALTDLMLARAADIDDDELARDLSIDRDDVYAWHLVATVRGLLTEDYRTGRTPNVSRPRRLSGAQTRRRATNRRA